MGTYEPYLAFWQVQLAAPVLYHRSLAGSLVVPNMKNDFIAVQIMPFVSLTPLKDSPFRSTLLLQTI